MRLYLDSNAIIYAHEGPPQLQQRVIERIIATCVTPGGIVMTSLLARLECRIKPLRVQDQQLLDSYQFFFERSGLYVLGITSDIIDLATDLRVRYGLRTPDAIHFATAINAQANTFLTADKSFAKCTELPVELVT